MKGLKNIYHANSTQRRVGVVKLILEKINFKSKKVTRNRRTLYVLKVSI